MINRIAISPMSSFVFSLHLPTSRSWKLFSQPQTHLQTAQNQTAILWDPPSVHALFDLIFVLVMFNNCSACSLIGVCVNCGLHAILQTALLPLRYCHKNEKQRRRLKHAEAKAVKGEKLTWLWKEKVNQNSPIETSGSVLGCALH